MTCEQKTAIVIPAYQPDGRLAVYVRALLEADVGMIVVVDDGSGEAYHDQFDALPVSERVRLISYTPNAGKGVALKRGLNYVQEHCPEQEIILTADSDGQHTVSDVLRMIHAMAENNEGILLGSRDFSQADVPKKSRMGNRITTAVFRLLYGRWVGDTQTGLRAFSSELLPMMAEVRGDRYEYEMNVLIACAGTKLPIRALPIQTVYENNNEGSHFRAVKDSARIYSVILCGFIRFISASMISFLVDYGMYLLLNNLLKTYVPAFEHEFRVLMLSVLTRIAVATIVARVVSGVVNYIINRNFVFASKSPIAKSFLKYLVVFVLIMLLSAGLTSSLHLGLGWSDNTAKIPVDIVLFFLSYYLQRRWVFLKDPKTKHGTKRG